MMLEQPTTVTGLDQAEVRARVQAGLVNTAPPMPGRTAGQILRANVFTRFNAILGAMFVVVLVVGPVQDALFGAVLVVNTGFGVIQELRAKRELGRLAILTAARARVIRDGAAAEIPVEQVVRDDVLGLRPGDQAPVDGLVLQTDGLEADEALLTGEAEPVAKQPGEQVLSGSFVVAGTGRVRATGVGGEAYAARLQAQARRFSLIRSELQQGINGILRLVTWVMIPAGLLVVLSEFFRSHDSLGDAAQPCGPAMRPGHCCTSAGYYAGRIQACGSRLCTIDPPPRSRTLKYSQISVRLSLGGGAGVAPAHSDVRENTSTGRALARLQRAVPDALGEEGQDPLPGVGGRDGLVGAPPVVEKGVLGSGVDLQVVRDARGRQFRFQHPGGFGGEIPARP